MVVGCGRVDMVVDVDICVYINVWICECIIGLYVYSLFINI